MEKLIWTLHQTDNTPKHVNRSKKVRMKRESSFYGYNVFCLHSYFIAPAFELYCIILQVFREKLQRQGIIFGICFVTFFIKGVKIYIQT